MATIILNEHHLRLIKLEALRLGFTDCGMSAAVKLEEDAIHLQAWLKQGMQGEMNYMENHFEKRTDPSLLVENARSVISLILSYHTTQRQNDPKAPVLSTYAYGKDYHKVVRKMLKRLLSFIQRDISPCKGRVFTDSAPVLDRAWAYRAGLGWIGKHSNLISPKYGSFFFIGSIVTDIPCEYRAPLVADQCGSCSRCMTLCPTNAIIAPKVVDARKCISYFTIEYKGDLPAKRSGQFQGRVFGCDICQDVCPYNVALPEHAVEAFTPSKALMGMTAADWHEMDKDTFEQRFSGSAVKRAGYKGLKRNLDFLNPSHHNLVQQH